MSGKIYCILGRSATGKTSVTNYLENMGHKIIISTTTRPIRDNEVEGKDYYFIPLNEFKHKLKHNDFLENTTYNNWNYGIDKTHLNLDSNDYIVVVEVNGYKQLVERLGKDRVIPLLLNVHPYIRLKRAIEREPYRNDATYKEICRRFLSDYELFEEFERDLPRQHIFFNVNSMDTARDIHNFINYGLEGDRI